MRICGFQKTTLLDFPGHVAATLFTGGCNFRCPFCHNGDLVKDPESQPGFSEEEIFSFLKKRKGILEGVCVTGGEPTLQPDLGEFLGKIKELGYLVKLDTNGYRPEVLRELLKEKNLDYMAMDIKAGWEHYNKATGMSHFEPNKIQESVDLIMHSGIDYEFRTTVVRGIHEPEEFEEIGRFLKGAKAYFLQSYKDSGAVLEPGYGAFPKEVLEEMAEKARKYIARVELRGVE